MFLSINVKIPVDTVFRILCIGLEKRTAKTSLYKRTGTMDKI